jgi:ABC-type uncharacterized transport system involved in gliding motility auxiliary subunit
VLHSVLAILGVVAIGIGWIIGFILPGTRGFTWLFIALGAGLLAVGLVLGYRRVRLALTSRRGLFGLGTSMSITLFVGVVLLANAVSSRTFYRFDFTGLEQFTLTSQTKDLLAGLDEPLEIIVFFGPSVPTPIANYGLSLLREYAIYTDQLTLRQVDPELRPDVARQYDVTEGRAVAGTVVFTNASGLQRHVYGPQVEDEAEHAFTSAILEVSGIRQRRIYFVTGHGEPRIEGDYRIASDALRDNLFDVREIDLLGQGIPPDAAAVVLAGPQQPLAPSELDSLTSHLEGGGGLVVLVNPNPQPELRQLLADWWIGVGDGYVVDPVSNVAPNLDVPLVSRDRNAFQLTRIYFPGATSVEPRVGAPPDYQQDLLVLTTGMAWLEKNSPRGVAPAFNPGLEVIEPLGLIATVESPPPTEGGRGARLAVVGDSDFAADQHFRNEGNSDVFLNLVNWAADGNEVIKMDRKVLTQRRLILSPEQARLLNFSSVALLPLLLLVAGGVIWWRRRR